MHNIFKTFIFIQYVLCLYFSHHTIREDYYLYTSFKELEILTLHKQLLSLIKLEYLVDWANKLWNPPHYSNGCRVVTYGIVGCTLFSYTIFIHGVPTSCLLLRNYRKET